MNFDYTNGRKPKYLVSLYGDNVQDKYYFHYYNEARVMFNKLKARGLSGAVLSLYDVVNDVRKDFAR